MKITDAPALITTPFAQNGTRNDIPATGDGLGTGRASLATGFPDETMKPITAGGVPPFGADFNGILYALSNAARFYGAGGHYQFNGSFAVAIGGYPMGATVQASDNMGHWLNVVESNSTDPESGLSTGWLPLADHNGTATVTLTGNTTLAPLQAAKANIRFTGSPAGNSTVTFPAWTKRYSIINDCTGDQSIICTTGNGESISIKNGAKYEIGCDGKNLTVATVNASQVFAEPNKNVSALDAPTVQQIINALGSAAAHPASDFDPSGSASEVNKSLIALKNALSSSATRLDSDNVERIGFDGNNRYQPYFYRKEDGAVTHLCPGDYVRMIGFHDGNQHLPFMRNISNDDVTWLVEGTEVNRIGIEGEYGTRPYIVRKADANWLYLATEAGVDEKLSSLNLGSASQKDAGFFETKESADLFKRSLGTASKLSSDDVEMKDDAAAFKNSLKPGAFMYTTAAAVDDLLGSNNEIANTKHIAELRERNKQTVSTLTELDQSAVKKVRLLLTVDSTMYPGAMYGENQGEVIGRIRLNGAVNGGTSNSITVYALQYLMNSIWVTVERGVF